MTPALETPATRANERELVDALRLRDSSAAERLVSWYGDRAARLATHLIWNEKDAEEAGRPGPRTDVSLDEVLPIFDEHGQYGAPVADWSAGVGDPSLQAELRAVLTEILSISLVDVTSRVHRARLFVRKHLAKYMVR